MTHGDHEWARDLVPVHLTGGLATEEQSRFDAHAENCAECIADIESLRRFDSSMQEVFAPVRPQPGLEERVIRSLRDEPTSRGRQWILAVAAVLFLGLLGFLADTQGLTSGRSGGETPKRRSTTTLAVQRADLDSE